MIEASDDLWLELSEMADAFADLGRRMLGASRLLLSPGVLPSVSLVEDLDDLWGRFEGLRDRTVRLAEALSVSIPAEGALDSLRGLAGLLEAVSEAEERRDAARALANRALGVLDRVLRLRHVHDDEFSPLGDCQDQARALRHAITRGEPEVPADQIAGLAEMDHPFACLLTMVEGNEGVDDDLWESLFEIVGTSFGKGLAAAVARSRVIATAEAEVFDPETEPVVPAAETPATPSVASFTLDWTGSARADLTVRLDTHAPEPVVASFPSDEVLNSVVTEVLPFIPRGLGSLPAARRFSRSIRRKSAPKVERLETMRLLSACATISGFVYLDSNNNGLFNAGETPIANNTIELHDATGALVERSQAGPAASPVSRPTGASWRSRAGCPDERVLTHGLRT
jgi:hypothetical protein